MTGDASGAYVEVPQWAKNAVRLEHVHGHPIYKGTEWVPLGKVRESSGREVSDAIEVLISACVDAANVHGRRPDWRSLRVSVEDDEPMGMTGGVDIAVRLRAVDQPPASAEADAHG